MQHRLSTTEIREAAQPAAHLMLIRLPVRAENHIPMMSRKCCSTWSLDTAPVLPKIMARTALFARQGQLDQVRLAVVFCSWLPLSVSVVTQRVAIGKAEVIPPCPTRGALPAARFRPERRLITSHQGYHTCGTSPVRRPSPSAPSRSGIEVNTCVPAVACAITAVACRSFGYR
jgi:hypothetical protein